MVTSNITHLEESAVKLCIGNSKNSSSRHCLQLHFPRFDNTVFFKEETTSFPFLLPLNNVVPLPKLPVRNNKGTNLSRVGRGADFFGR